MRHMALLLAVGAFAGSAPMPYDPTPEFRLWRDPKPTEPDPDAVERIARAEAKQARKRAKRLANAAKETR
jgi:hypothetical protein